MIHKADKELKQRWEAVFNSLSDDNRLALRMALYELKKDAAEKAEYSWRKHKAPMALYWKVISVYTGHLMRSIKI